MSLKYVIYSQEILHTKVSFSDFYWKHLDFTGKLTINKLLRESQFAKGFFYLLSNQPVHGNRCSHHLLFHLLET